MASPPSQLPSFPPHSPHVRTLIVLYNVSASVCPPTLHPPPPPPPLHSPLCSDLPAKLGVLIGLIALSRVGVYIRLPGEI